MQTRCHACEPCSQPITFFPVTPPTDEQLDYCFQCVACIVLGKSDRKRKWCGWEKTIALKRALRMTIWHPNMQQDHFGSTEEFNWFSNVWFVCLGDMWDEHFSICPVLNSQSKTLQLLTELIVNIDQIKWAITKTDPDVTQKLNTRHSSTALALALMRIKQLARASVYMINGSFLLGHKPSQGLIWQ